MARVLIGTIALEMNRWSNRVPSYKVSDWLSRFNNDGFDGMELWENHVIHEVSEGEAAKIKDLGFPVSVYNTYALFGEDDAEKRKNAAKMIEYFNVDAVKFNVGDDLTQIDVYKSNLLEFADTIPSKCRLLCECHGGTILDDNKIAKDFFTDLPEGKFGIIIHPFDSVASLQEKFDMFGSRITHVHSQLQRIENEKTLRLRLDEWPEHVSACFDVFRKYNFCGSFTIEFTGGTASVGENIDTLYENALADMAFIRKNLL